MAKNETVESPEDIKKLVENEKPKNELMRALRSKAGKEESHFECNASVVAYKTNFPQLDYFLGYNINVYNENDEIIGRYPSLGITGGSYITFIGKPSTSKTTTACQIAANVVRPFPNGSVIHYDLEQAMNYTRIQKLTRFQMSDIKAGKYILRQEKNSISDIKKDLMDLYMEKVSSPEKYKYKTGELNEFGEEIVVYEPTVVIIDSIATLSTGLNENDKKDLKKLEEVGSQTDRMRVTGEIGRFYTELLPYIRTANIIVISINQIKVNPQMGIVKSASEILYLKQDETLPGGKSPQFLAHILIKFVAIGSDKYNLEEDGFDGFGVRLEIIKSRVSQAGQYVNLVYDKERGIDALRSSIFYAKDLGLTGGNRNAFYFSSHKDQKFALASIHEEFRENRELFKIMYSNIIPELEQRLVTVEESDLEILDEESDYSY